jgi:hypothetical protein
MVAAILRSRPKIITAARAAIAFAASPALTT